METNCSARWTPVMLMTDRTVVPGTTTSHSSILTENSCRVESELTELFRTRSVASTRLAEAMRYATLGGGKRLRATLVYAAGELLGARGKVLDAAACAVELVHAYSLVHDDLPAMDDDNLRRGRPTCHIQYDEATAILVGDGLQSLAMETLLSERFNPGDARIRAAMAEVLVRAIGDEGMVGGQAIDIEFTGMRKSLEELSTMHALKTGALIEASVLLGGIAALGPGHRVLDVLSRYGRALGLSFQIADDILDHTSDSMTLGKDAGSDDRQNKTTYVSVMGLDKAREEASRVCRDAVGCLRELEGDTGFLQYLAEFTVSRKS
ncbi:MAG: geranyl transferase [Gammaproteobacteria bacterium]|nr:geranyl transferase [Gammaproteobacteria bacterium]MYD76718.1 geranyl transferase [Gammaproteobacteria bacterium]